MPPRFRAIALVLGGIVSVQVGAAFAKGIFTEVTPLTMVCVRQLTSTIILWAIVRPTLRGRSRESWRAVAQYAVALGMMNWAIYESFARIPIGLAVAIEFLGPLGIAVWRSARRLDLVWVALAGVGVASLGFERTKLDPIGVGFALLAGVMWAGYIVASTKTGQVWAGLEGLAVASLFCALVTTPLMLFTTGVPSAHVWSIGLLVGLLSSVIPYSAELIALRTLDQHTFSVMLSLEPGAAALAALVVLNEQLAALQWIAIALVVIASVGVNWGTARQPPTTANGPVVAS